MVKVKIIFGTSTGSTGEAAEKIAKMLGDRVEAVMAVEDASTSDFEGDEILILGSPSWNVGELQFDWEDFIDEMDKLDLTGRTVALFGLGDQHSYSDTFQNAIGILYRKVTELGAQVVGQWPIDGYEFDDSLGVVDGRFVGLALDDINQSELTDERLQRWIESLLKELDENEQIDGQISDIG